MSECHSKDDPRFEAAKSLLIAADIFSHSLMVTVDKDGTLAARIMRTVQLMICDTIPYCLYEDVLVEAVAELYPPEVRKTLADSSMEIIKNSPHEPSANDRSRMVNFLQRLQDGE